jgi:hypothetical protein
MRWSCVWAVVVFVGQAWADDCPLDKHPFPLVNVMLGTTTGTRLDLRPIGSGVVLPPLKRCSQCGFLADWPLRTEEDKQPVRAILASPASVAARAQRSNRFLRAVLLSQLPESAFDQARAWLEAAWETEGVDEPRHRQSLEAALAAFHAAEVAFVAKPPEYFSGRDLHDQPRTARVLQVELLRQLGRFDEASAALKVLEGLDEFGRGVYPSLLEQERTLLKARNPGPQPMRRVTYNEADDAPPFVMAHSIEGWAAFSQAFEVARPSIGNINGELKALHISVRSKAPRLVDAVWWWNLLDEHDRPKSTYPELVASLEAAQGIARKQPWLEGWKANNPTSAVELQLVGTRPWTTMDFEQHRAKWNELGLPGTPAVLFILRRARHPCFQLVLSADGASAMVPTKYDGCPGSHWLDALRPNFASEVIVLHPDGSHEIRAVGRPTDAPDGGRP